MPGKRPHKKQNPVEAPPQPEEMAGVEGETAEGMPQAVLTVRGGVDKIKKHVLDVQAPPAAGAPEAPAEDEPEDDARAMVREALKNPNNIVRGRRIRPRRHANTDVNVEVYEDRCPIDLATVEEEIALHGGRRYVIEVIDPETNRAVAACFKEVPGDPILQSAPGASGTGPKDEDEEEGAGTIPPTAEEQTIAELQAQDLITRQEIALEQNKARLESLRSRGKTKDPESEQQVREMERRLQQQETDIRIAKIQAENEKKMADMERRFAERAAQPTIDPLASVLPVLQQVISRPAPDPTAAITPLLQIFMKKMDQDSAQFQSLMAQMRDDKLSGLQKSLEDLKRPAKQNTESMSEVFENILRLRQISAKLSGDEIDDDEPDAGEGIEQGSPWFALAKEYAPKFFQMIEALAGNKTGPQLTREEVERKFAEAANAAAAQTIQQLRSSPQGLPAPAPVNPVAPQPIAAQPMRALPAPAPVAAPAPVVLAPTRPAPVQVPAVQPVPVAAPPPQPPPAPVPAPAPVAMVAHPVGPTPSAPPATYVQAPGAPPIQTPQVLSEEEAVRQVVAPVLVTLANEMAMRPMEYVWNAFVWRTLPQDMIQAIAAAPNAAALVHVFDGHASPEGIAQLATRAGDPRVAAWIQRGHQELKGWWDQFCKDPTFDPFADSEEEGEGEAL
jgi:hypothetical protein